MRNPLRKLISPHRAIPWVLSREEAVSGFWESELQHSDVFVKEKPEVALARDLVLAVSNLW